VGASRRVEQSMQKHWMVLAGVNGLIGVAAGAFGAHALAGLPERYLNAFRTGAQYQMYHALALLVLTALPRTPLLNGSGYAFLGGIVLFSGSLYALALTRIGVFGAITPVGGGLFLLGWALTVAAALRRK
jgi:uncharacterized membrane protein YgdD (TMEM256/DUF423 family)